jgi:hypothetical protein
MKKIYQFLAALLLLVTINLASLNVVEESSAAVHSASSGQFTVFDGTLYKNVPSLASYGVQRINIVYGGRFWDRGQNKSDLPDETRVRRLARDARLAGDIAVIDIEHWPTREKFGSVEEGLFKYLTVLRWFQEEAPGLRVGYYGVPPIRDYWRAIEGSSSAKFVAWRGENELLGPLASQVDILYPSIYTFYADRKAWVRYAIAQIEEARRYNPDKPVFAFLWPQFHNSNRLLGGRFLPADFWRVQLETVYRYADGVVIWGGWDLGKNRPMEWDESAAWWHATKQFLREIEKY